MWGLVLSLLKLLGLSPVSIIAAVFGTDEAAINLLISILMAYPLAIGYHKMKLKSAEHKNLYFILCGIDMAFFNFGISMYHNMVPVIIFYFTNMVLGPGKNNVIVTFAVNMAYLLTGYVMTESENYDITWTMPHCILTLKLIALSFDLWDGQEKVAGKPLSVNSTKTALVTAPTLPELIGFIYFPAAFLVGPQFSFKRYHDFINDKFPNDVKVYEKIALTKLVQGFLYLSAFQIGASVFNMDFMLSDDFWDTSIFYRQIYCGLWAHFALYKYVSCWLLSEAACIRLGFSYNGTRPGADGRPESRWDGCTNIKPLRFECATKFQHYIDSFNCNTNHFAAEYIYKRLKFLGDRNLSQLFTLLFLSVWHGIRSGYYMTFFNEFIIIFMEKGFESIVTKTKLYHTLWSNVYAKSLMYIILKLYTTVFMGWSLVPFAVKEFSKWWSIYYSLYFSGFLLFLPWAFVYKPLLIYVIKSLKLSEKN